MNTTVARCGHSVAAIGAPGSYERSRQASMLCKLCLESAKELVDWLRSNDATCMGGARSSTGVDIEVYNVRGVLTHILKYDDGSWDILMPCSSSVRIGDTLKAATDHLKRLAS